MIAANLEAERSSPVPWEREFVLQLGVIALLFTAVFGPTIRQNLVGRWLSDPNWSHGWLIPAISLYLIFAREPAGDASSAARGPRPSVWGAAVLAAVLAAHIYFWAILPIGYLRSLCVPAAIFGLVWLLGGTRAAWQNWFPVAYLILALPLPYSIYHQVTLPLRQWASQLAGLLLSLIPDIHVDVREVVIRYLNLRTGEGGSLNVEEACSGMRLLMSFMAIGLAVAYLGRRTGWQRVIIALFCIPIAVFCNLIRVTTTGLLYIGGHQELAHGTPHAMLGIAVLFLALGLFNGLGWILDHLLVEEESERPITA